MFLLYNPNARVLRSGTIILRIQVGPSVASGGAWETVGGRNCYDGRDECGDEEGGDGFSPFGGIPVDESSYRHLLWIGDRESRECVGRS